MAKQSAASPKISLVRTSEEVPASPPVFGAADAAAPAAGGASATEENPFDGVIVEDVDAQGDADDRAAADDDNEALGDEGADDAEAAAGDGEEGDEEGAPAQGLGYRARLEERRKTWRERETQKMAGERSEYEQRIQSLAREVEALKARPAAIPDDPFEALEAIGRRHNLSASELYQRIGEKLAAGGAEPGTAESRLERELSALKNEFQQERAEKVKHQRIAQLNGAVEDGMAATMADLSKDFNAPDGLRELPWIKLANPAAVKRKAVELWREAVFHSKPGEHDALDVLAALDEHFSEVFAWQLKDSAKAAPRAPSSAEEPAARGRRRTTPGTARRAPGRPAAETQAERDRLARSEFDAAFEAHRPRRR